MIFLDTSVIFALADARDSNNSHAIELFRRATESGEVILIHNYVLAEAAALLQHRLGLSSALSFLRQAEAFQVHWITAEDHQYAVDLLRGAEQARTKPGGLRELYSGASVRGPGGPGLRPRF